MWRPAGAPAGCASCLPSTRRCTPGAVREWELNGRDIGVLGELHPRWRQAYELPHSPLLFELDLDALLERPLPTSPSLAQASGCAARPGGGG